MPNWIDDVYWIGVVVMSIVHIFFVCICFGDAYGEMKKDRTALEQAKEERFAWRFLLLPPLAIWTWPLCLALTLPAGICFAIYKAVKPLPDVEEASS